MVKIIISNLYKSFGNRKVLKNVNFEVNEGEIFAYIGPNGAGKTTTLRILLKVLEPENGKAEIFGDGNVSLPPNKIGFVLENEEPFENFTPEEYLKFFTEIYRIENPEEKIESLLKKLNLDKRRKEKIFTFSKGMKRKLCVAKALISKPEVLFLDEPFEGLEIEARKEIKDIIVGSRENIKIVFIISHNLYELEPLCNAFGIIIEGSFKGKWYKEGLKNMNLEEFYFKVKDS